MKPLILHARVQLEASRCPRCDVTWHPRRERCPTCIQEVMEEVLLPERGELYSFSVVRIGRPGVEVPYGVAVVDFGNVRVFGRLINWESARIGDETVVMQVGPRANAPESLQAGSVGYQFFVVERKG